MYGIHDESPVEVHGPSFFRSCTADDLLMLQESMHAVFTTNPADLFALTFVWLLCESCTDKDSEPSTQTLLPNVIWFFCHCRSVVGSALEWCLDMTQICIINICFKGCEAQLMNHHTEAQVFSSYNLFFTKWKTIWKGKFHKLNYMKIFELGVTWIVNLSGTIINSDFTQRSQESGVRTQSLSKPRINGRPSACFPSSTTSERA